MFDVMILTATQLIFCKGAIITHTDLLSVTKKGQNQIHPIICKECVDYC